MHIIDGFAYIDESENPIKITKVTPLGDRKLIVTFNTGEERIFDSNVLDGTVYEPLKDRDVFDSVAIDKGVLTWLDGKIDCAPEYVYANSYIKETDNNPGL